jgi:general secretion pathway protein K
MKQRQLGAALLAAMLTVSLVATFAAAALWQQWRSIEIEAADRQRVQSTWILTGALDWARLILREDRGNVDHLAEPWAVPLQEARLSTFLAADRDNNAMTETSDADNVFLSGDIVDLQGRFNITSLIQAGVVQEVPAETLRRLFDVLGLPQAQLGPMMANLRFAGDIHVDNLNAASAPLLPQRVEQLVWLGLSAETVAALKPYVTVLPDITPVNLNTAPAEVIYAVARNIGLADAQRLVAERERQHFGALQDVTSRLPAGATLPAGCCSVSSGFFEVRGRLRIDDMVIEEHSMVKRQGAQVHTLQRERGAIDAVGAAAPRR